MSSGGSVLRIIGSLLGQLLRAILGGKSQSTSQTTKPSGSSKPKSTPTVKTKAKSNTKTQATIKPTPGRSDASGLDVVSTHAQELAARERLLEGEPSPGQLGKTATVEIAPPSGSGIVITYDPNQDRDPDAGEIVWTWIPYEEADGRGKDRPVLVIAKQSADRVFVVRLTSKSHDGDRDFMSIGSGAWDSQGRESWVDIDQVYSVHAKGMRREAAALDRKRFSNVANALRARYGWSIAG